MRQTLRRIMLVLFLAAVLAFPWWVVFNLASDQLRLKDSGVPVTARFAAAQDGEGAAYRCRRPLTRRRGWPTCHYYVEYVYRDVEYTRELLGQEKGTWPLFGGFEEIPQAGETVDAVVDPENKLKIWSATSIDQWWKGVLFPGAVAGVWTLLVGIAIALMLSRRKSR